MVEIVGSQQFSSTIVTTVECSSFDAGINLINSYISKQINLSHAKIIVFSEALASSGIGKYISTFVNNVEIRPDCNIIVSRCSAEDFLNNSSPSLEVLSARYYEQVLASSKYTGLVPYSSLINFYSAYKDYASQPIAILGGINSNATHNVNLENSYWDLDESYLADETPIKNKTNIEFTGLAIFNEDKLVGELTGMDSICHLICTNKFESTIISIPSPFNQNQIIDLSIENFKQTQINVSLANDSPYILVDVNLKGVVDSAEYMLDLTDEDNVKLIEEYASSYLENKILNYLYSTAKKYYTDIVGFGRYLAYSYITDDEYLKLNWPHLYLDSFFNCHVDIDILNGNLLVHN